MRVVVTGVAGRVGSSLAQELARSGHDVRGVVRPRGRRPHASMMREIGIVQADLGDAYALEQAVIGADVVVHLAAQMLIGDTSVERFFDVNVGGTLRLLEACVSQRRPPRQFVLASTDNVYGPGSPEQLPISEEHPQVPGDYYGTSKVLAEDLARNYQKLHGLPCSIVRLASVLAPNEISVVCRLDWARAFLSAHVAAGRRSNLWSLFAEHPGVVSALDAAVPARADNPALVLTGPDGDPWAIHFTDVRDAVSGIMLAIEHEAAVGDEFNIAAQHTTRFDEAAQALVAHAHTGVARAALPVRLGFELSIEKARRRLGFAPQWDFASSLASITTPDTTVGPVDYVPVREA